MEVKKFDLCENELNLVISILNNYFINIYELLYNIDQK